MRRIGMALALAFALACLPLHAGASNDPLFSQQWSLQNIGAPRAWSEAMGDGVVIAVVDSGVDLKHVDLASKIVPGANFIEPGQAPQDDCGHGTHVAGIAAASTSNGIGVAGVAPNAKIMPVRVLASDGSGGCSGGDVSVGIRWAADHGARVVNLSLGSDTEAVFGPSFSDAISYAWSKGAICVVAAGNQFILSSGFGDQPAIVVSATDRNDNKPTYSSGVGDAKWGMAAPGGAGNIFGPRNASVDILSTYFDPNQPNNHNAYTSLAGTSMATPMVSGAAAVLLSMGLSKQQVVDRLLSTADNVGSASTFGHGRLNLDRAVHAGTASATTPIPHSTKATQAPATPGSTTAVRAGRTSNPGPASSSPSVASTRPTPDAHVSYAAPAPAAREHASRPLVPAASVAVGFAAASAAACWLRLRRRGTN